MALLQSLVLALALGAAAPGPPPVPDRRAPVLFHGGRIHLNDGKGSVVDGLLVRDGRVAAVGRAADLLVAEDSAAWTLVDLEGATAVPGLQDGHGHLETVVDFAGTPDLTGCADMDELVERLRTHAEGLPPETWIVARGFESFGWGDVRGLHHGPLTEAFPANPVLCFDAAGHAVLANRAAMDRAGIDAGVVASQRARGGLALVDDDGEATGVFLDTSLDLFEGRVGRAEESVRLARLLEVQERLLALGVTAVHEMGASVGFVRLLDEARRSGRLRLRVIVYMSSRERWNDQILATLPVEPDPADLLCLRGVEIRIDGVLSSRGAALIEGYADAPGYHGRLRLKEGDLAHEVLRVSRAGLQPVVHAVGDRANRMAINVLEGLTDAVPSLRTQRPRIEHALVVATKDWPRFPAVGLIPSLQPARAAQLAPLLELRLGASRTYGAQAWRSLAPELGRLAFGSDFPAGDPDPLRGLYAARVPSASAADTGDGPGQALYGAEALLGFTAGAAYACHQEDRRGRLEPGYWADLTVIDVDPVLCAPEELLEARVRMTVVNGTILFRDAGR